MRDWEGYRARQHAETGAIAQIRTVVGAQAFHEIVAVLGLAGVMPGPLDLLVSIGMKANWRDERVQAELQRMIELAVEAGVTVILPVFALTPAGNRELIAAWQARGARAIAIGADKTSFLKRWFVGQSPDPCRHGAEGPGIVRRIGHRPACRQRHRRGRHSPRHLRW